MNILPMLMLVIFAIPVPAAAQIYKWVDADGNVVYSDVPNNQAEEINPPEVNTVPMPKLPPRPAAEEKDEPAGYNHFSIASPRNDEVVRDNNGRLTIVLQTRPELQGGHYFSILIDGYVMVKKSTQYRVTVEDISRGEHKITALLRDANGKTLATSKPVIVHMKRASIIPVNRAAIGPVYSNGAPVQPGPAGVRFKPGPATPAFKPGPVAPTAPVQP